MAVYPKKTFPCSVNSVPFYPNASDRRVLDATPNVGHAPYTDTSLIWQTPLLYYNKRLFGDYITLQFKTQRNSPVVISPSPAGFQYTHLAKLYVYSSKRHPATGQPIPDKEVTSFTSALNPTISGFTYPFGIGGSFWGVQGLTFDVYTDPILRTTVPLTSYMWQFTFGDHLDATTDGGVYFIRFDNYDSDGAFETWYSEPIFVYGTDAQEAFPDTLEFECASAINRNDILVNGWFNNPSRQVYFTNRVEGDILEYDQKSVYMGFLEQNFLASETYAKSWKTWNLNIGGVTAGVPATLLEIINKLMELEYPLINNQYYVYDIANGGGSSPANAWKITKDRVNGLKCGTLPIRHKYDNQFYLGSPIALPHRFDPTRFDPAHFR